MGADTSPHIVNISLCGIYTTHCNRTVHKAVRAHCTRLRLLSDSPRARSFVLGADITGACNVVSVTRPSPCARLPQ
jgi:hypothetical protein